MTILLETYDDIGDYDICKLLPTGHGTIITRNKNNIISKIEDFCKKTNKTIIIMSPYKMQTVFDFTNYIEAVTNTIDSALLFSKIKTKEIEEYQLMGEHKNKK